MMAHAAPPFLIPALLSLLVVVAQAVRRNTHVATQAHWTSSLASLREETHHGEALLCGLGAGDEAQEREKLCAEVCLAAMGKIELPPFPKDFFGGLDRKKREAGASPINGLVGASTNAKDGEIEAQATLVFVEADASFAYPMALPAYYTCYTRSKWPLFTAWVIDPELQTGGVERSGAFGNLDKGSDEYKSYNAMIPDEFLRSSDVKGVWNVYFGLDQGHWAPDAAFRTVGRLVQSTYYYINVSPQTSCLNQGEWFNLESKVRSWAVDTLGGLVSIMAGPLERLPEQFLDTQEKKIKWTSLLEKWRASAEILMNGIPSRDPHWMELVKHTALMHDSDGPGPKHCFLGSYDKTSKPTLADVMKIDTCTPGGLAPELSDYAVYLMTEAGTKGQRRGVRVPLAYWKVASWKDLEKDKQLYCCWLFDQTGAVAEFPQDDKYSGPACLKAVKELGADVLPRMLYAGKKTCGALYTPRPNSQGNMPCNFRSAGIDLKP